VVDKEKPSVRIVGRYALYGTIAAGGMATVHFGRLLGPVGFSRTVAIKRLHPQFAADPEFVSMFLDEARLAARIRHPHVVPTLDVVATNGELFLVMDYVPGESLSRLIRASRERGERIPVQITIAIMSGVLQGLHAAHEARNERGEPLGIVHRDVSPQNVLVGSDGQARVLDFGVAKAAGRIQTTREGQLKGKLAYMAPEQLRSEALTRKTDIYAAAVVLWESLTCERLFGGDNEGAVVTKVLQGEIPPPSTRLIDLTKTLDSSVMRGFERLDAVVLRGLDRDVATRFDSAREMALALEKCFTPATAAEVSDWVERVASPVLMARAGQIAEIESGSSSMPRGALVEGALKEHAAGGGAWHPELGALGQEAPTETAISSSNVQPSQLSSISVASNAALPQSSPAGRRIGLVVLAATAIVAVPLALFALLRSPGTPAQTAAGATASGASSGASPPSSAGLVIGEVAVPPPADSTSASADTAKALGSAEAPKPTAAQQPRVPSATWRTRTSRPAVSESAAPHSTPPPASTADGCNPPYTWDAEGRKHYKPNCL
jgi:serine/threonine-protein kinase